MLEARLTVEDPDLAVSVVDNVLVLHQLNLDRALLYDIGLSSSPTKVTSGRVSPRASVDQINQGLIYAQDQVSDKVQRRDQFEVCPVKGNEVKPTPLQICTLVREASR